MFRIGSKSHTESTQTSVWLSTSPFQPVYTHMQPWNQVGRLPIFENHNSSIPRTGFFHIRNSILFRFSVSVSATFNANNHTTFHTWLESFLNITWSALSSLSYVSRKQDFIVLTSPLPWLVCFLVFLKVVYLDFSFLFCPLTLFSLLAYMYQQVHTLNS